MYVYVYIKNSPSVQSTFPYLALTTPFPTPSPTTHHPPTILTTFPTTPRNPSVT